MPEDAATILVADDNENDRWSFQKAFKAVAPTLAVEFARDGQETIEYLVSNPMPSLLVLDHNMTRLNAFGVLKWLHDDETLKDLPVVIVSGTKSADEAGKALKLGARAYFAKPFDFADMKHLVRTLLQYCSDVPPS